MVPSLTIRIVALEDILPRARFRVRRSSRKRTSFEEIQDCGRPVRFITTEEIEGEIHVVDGADLLLQARYAGSKEILTADIGEFTHQERLAIRLHLALDYTDSRSGAVR